MTTIKFSLIEIERLIENFEGLSKKLHELSIDSYPIESYQEYDKQSLNFLQGINFFLNIQSVKEIELEIKNKKLKIQYLQSRSEQLEDFLLNASDDDQKFLFVGINDLRTESLKIRTEIEKLKKTTFQIDIPDWLLESVNNFKLENRSDK